VECDPSPDEDVIAIRTWGSHPALFIYSPLALWRLLRSERYDLIDVHEEPYSLAAAEIAVLRTLAGGQQPLIFYTAQNLNKRYPLPFRLIERIAMRKAAAIYPCSEGAARVIREKGYAGRVQVLPLGVDTGRFKATGARVNGHAERRFRVGYVGRLVRHKGVDRLLAAGAARQTWSIDVAGAGDQELALRAQAERLRMADRVTFHGGVPHEALADLYRRFHALAIPSIPTPGVSEQFCRVAIEAMACGVPVVASDVGNLPELVGDAGITVPAGSPDALGEALDRLAADDGLRADLARRGIERAQRFSWAEVAGQHAALYREVLG